MAVNPTKLGVSKTIDVTTVISRRDCCTFSSNVLVSFHMYASGSPSVDVLPQLVASSKVSVYAGPVVEFAPNALNATSYLFEVVCITIL